MIDIARRDDFAQDAWFSHTLTSWLMFVETAMPNCPWEVVDALAVVVACGLAVFATAWWRWFGLDEKRWLLLLVWIALAVRMVVYLCTSPPLLARLANAGQGVAFIVLVTFGVRRQGRAGWVAFPIVLLFAGEFFTNDLRRLGLPVSWIIMGIEIDVRQMADLIVAAAMSLLIIRRFQKSQRRKQQLEADLRQARQVQQVLLPQEIPAIAGFRIECDYRPAQQVGGDFFQVLETGDNGLLVIVGDVSGKGLRAAMLVALTVGALRTIADETEEPSAILQRLNHRLMGRMEGGFTTCLCARIGRDGVMTLANAGHLAPWLDGKRSMRHRICRSA